MVKTALVGMDIEAGKRILNVLDEASLNIKVALWFYSPEEYSDWRLILSSPRFNRILLTDVYGLIFRHLDAAAIPFEEADSLMAMYMTDPFIKALRRHFAKTEGIEGMHLGGQLYGDRYIQEGYVYRIS